MSKKQLIVWICTGIILVILAGCSNKNEEKSIDERDDEAVDEQIEEDAKTNDPDDLSLSDFFLSDGKKASFKGDGDEFATFSLTFHHLDDQHIAIDEDNGGSLVRRIFKVEEERIVIISEQIIEQDDPLPSIESLASLTTQYIFLEKPIKEGHSFGGWTIAELNSTVETPYKTFDNAIKLEMIDHGFKNITYIVPQFGEVLRESIMENEDGKDFIITSSLQSVENEE